MSNSKSTYRILAVCLGNICRSPLAEGLLRQEADKRQLPWEIDSAGTSGWHQGEAPDSRSRAVARQHNLNIDQQRSRKVRFEDFAEYDLILAMDRQNGIDLRRMVASSQSGRAHVAEILDISGLSEIYGPDVIDPYHDDDGFQSVYDILQQAAIHLADRYEAGQLPNQNPDYSS